MEALLPLIAATGGVNNPILKHLVWADMILKAISKLPALLPKKSPPQSAMHNIPYSSPKKSSIKIHRVYSGEKIVPSEAFDAIMWRVSHTPDTKHMKLASNGVFSISHNEPIDIGDDIQIVQSSSLFDATFNLTEASLDVFSMHLDLIQLQSAIQTIITEYDFHKKNQLGDKLYYFDEMPVTLPRTIDKSYNLDLAPRHLTYMMSRMYTNKNMNNVYGTAMRVVRKRIDFFMTNKKWYQDMGVPYTLGILMHGVPGAGKTSLIKALSKDCRRHVFNIKLSPTTTVSQINSLFFTDKVVVNSDGTNVTYNIPIDKRLIVMEDVDCLSHVVLARKHNKDDTNDISQFVDIPQSSSGCINFDSFSPLNNVSHIGEKAPHPEQLSLSYILNVLDGVLETPGRIVIMTSNHPEKLDPALIRPGRMDLNIHFDRCNRDDIREMIEKITGMYVPDTLLENVPEFKYTPAEVTQKIFENMGVDMETLVGTLIHGV